MIRTPREFRGFLTTAMVLLASPAICQVPSDIPTRAQKVQELAAQRLAAAQPVSLSSAFYCIIDTVESEVFVTNVFSAAIDFEISAFNPAGERYRVGSYTVAPRRHVRVSLTEALHAADTSFEAGSLAIDFNGDLLMLEAWLVMSSGEGPREQFIEWPFTRLGENKNHLISSFWDTRLLPPKTKPTYRLANAADYPATYTLRIGRGQRTLFTQRYEIAPRSVVSLNPAQQIAEGPAGWIRVDHSEPGDVLSAVGWLSLGPPGQTPFLATLPIDTTEPTGLPVARHSLGLSLEQPRTADQASRAPGVAAIGRSVLSLHNSGTEPQELEIGLLDFETGEEIARSKRVVAPGEISSLDLARYFRRSMADRSGLRQVRARIWGGDDTLRLWAGKVSADGIVTDLTFMADTEANASGLYALPALEDHEIVNTLINLGDAPASVRAQISWEGGTYALPPITIDPGATYQLDIGAIAAEKGQDLLGRSLDPNYSSGYLQWVTNGGSSAILDRLEIRKKDGGSRDLFGFRYRSCCTRAAFPGLIPGGVIFPAGSSTGLLACEYINSCTGILGPYNASIISLTYSAPASWNGVTVSASNETSQQVSFEALGVDFDCYEYEQFSMFDSGSVDTCETFNPNGYNPNKTCWNQGSLVQTCGMCCLCCKFLYREQICNCGASAGCKLQAESALGACKTGCAINLNCNQSNYCAGK